MLQSPALGSLSDTQVLHRSRLCFPSALGCIWRVVPPQTRPMLCEHLPWRETRRPGVWAATHLFSVAGTSLALPAGLEDRCSKTVLWAHSSLQLWLPGQ